MLHAFIEMRRRGFAPEHAVAAADGNIHALASGASGVMHVLFRAAPHNATFKGLLRAHLGKPMVHEIRTLIPRVDADYGITRTPAELDSKVRVFMSLFAGYFTTTLLYDAPPNDDAIVSAMLAIMGWEPNDQTK